MQVEIPRLYNPAGNVEGLVKAGDICFCTKRRNDYVAGMGTERDGQIERVNGEVQEEQRNNSRCAGITTAKPSCVYCSTDVLAHKSKIEIGGVNPGLPGEDRLPGQAQMCTGASPCPLPFDGSVRGSQRLV